MGLADRAGPVWSLCVGTGAKARRTPRGAASSGAESGAAASTRVALYLGEAPRRRPVTPGPAGPSGLPPRHSLAPLHSARSRDRPAVDRHRSTQRASEPATSASGQQQASARPGPTPLSGPLQLRRSGAQLAIGGGPCRSVLISTPAGRGACLSLSLVLTHLLPGAHWSGARLPRPRGPPWFLERRGPAERAVWAWRG